jgi:hypothetical protein
VDSRSAISSRESPRRAESPASDVSAATRLWCFQFKNAENAASNRNARGRAYWPIAAAPSRSRATAETATSNVPDGVAMNTMAIGCSNA